MAESLADRAPMTTTRAARLASILGEARGEARPGWDLVAAPSNAYVRFSLLGGDVTLRWLATTTSTRAAGLDTVPKRIEVEPDEVAETNRALAECSNNLGRIFETTATRVKAWAEQTVERSIRAAGARTLDEVARKARRAALGGSERQREVCAALRGLPPGDRLSAVPRPIRAAVESEIERRVAQLIGESAVGSLEAILDAFRGRQVTEFARLAQISIAQAGEIFGVAVPTSAATAVTSSRLTDLVLGRLDPGELVVGSVDAAQGLVPGSIANDSVLISGGAQVDDAGLVIRDALGRAIGRDGGIADGGIGTFRTRLVEHGQRIADRNAASARITARLDIESGLRGSPSAAERQDLLSELRGLSDNTPGRDGLGAGTLNGDAGRWTWGGGGPFGEFPPHLALNGEEWLDLPGREVVTKADDPGGFPYVVNLFPGDHLGCSCFIEPNLQIEVPA